MSLISKMLRIAGRSPSGVAKAIKTDEEGNLGVLLTGKKVEWIDHLSQTLTANNNTTDADFAYRDVLGFDRIDVYIQCDTAYDIIFKTAKSDMTLKKTYPKKESNPATTSIGCEIFTLRTDDGELILPDKLNIILINKSSTTTANIVVKIRGYKGVRS